MFKKVVCISKNVTIEAIMAITTISFMKLEIFSISFTKLLLLPFRFLLRLFLTQIGNLLTIFQRIKELYSLRYGLFSRLYY